MHTNNEKKRSMENVIKNIGMKGERMQIGDKVTYQKNNMYSIRWMLWRRNKRRNH